MPYQVNAKSVQNGTVKVVSCLESCRSTVSDDDYSCSNMEFPKTGVRCCKLFFFNSFNPIIKKNPTNCNVCLLVPACIPEVLNRTPACSGLPPSHCISSLMHYKNLSVNLLEK